MKFFIVFALIVCVAQLCLGRPAEEAGVGAAISTFGQGTNKAGQIFSAGDVGGAVKQEVQTVPETAGKLGLGGSGGKLLGL